MIKCPCKECENRTSACHAACKPYMEWKKEHDAIMEDLRKRRDGPISMEALRRHWINLRYINRKYTKK